MKETAQAPDRSGLKEPVATVKLLERLQQYRTMSGGERAALTQDLEAARRHLEAYLLGLVRAGRRQQAAAYRELLAEYGGKRPAGLAYPGPKAEVKPFVPSTAVRSSFTFSTDRRWERVVGYIASLLVLAAILYAGYLAYQAIGGLSASYQAKVEGAGD
jgi:hypothetical protein